VDKVFFKKLGKDTQKYIKLLQKLI